MFQTAVQKTDAFTFVPPPVTNIEQTGLSFLWLEDHILKLMYFQGYLTGYKIAEEIALPFAGIVDKVVEALKREKLLEVRSASNQMGIGEGSYMYGITGAGIARAREALERNQYAGPAPVPIQMYNEACHKQSRTRVRVNPRSMRQVLSHMVLSEKTFHLLGPAINSGTSIFLYGPPGDGKTTVAKALGQLTGNQEIYIPYSIYIDGQVIKLYDSVNHVPAPLERENEKGTSSLKQDPRWIKIKRPFITVGGELNLEGLDLVFDSVIKYYEAPFQVKANGGILLIDDFGRQLVRPRDLLNRWIVPLESRIDYLTLHTGKKIEIPFDVLVIFSTNLPPRDLVDEAFLRRLRHKIEIGDPTYEEFREIFKRVSHDKGVPYNDQGLAYLLQEWYIKRNRKLRANHPRDLVELVIDVAGYLGIDPVLNPELIDKAAEAYFVDL